MAQRLTRGVDVRGKRYEAGTEVTDKELGDSAKLLRKMGVLVDDTTDLPAQEAAEAVLSGEREIGTDERATVTDAEETRDELEGLSAAEIVEGLRDGQLDPDHVRVFEESRSGGPRKTVLSELEEGED